jgi:hypothetical protein
VKRVVLAVLVAVVVVGCDGEEPKGTPPPTSKACTDSRGLRLDAVNGDVACDEMRDVAAAYDLGGEKVQEIRAWTCATGTAETRPTVFTCALGDKEFAAEEAGRS